MTSKFHAVFLVSTFVLAVATTPRAANLALSSPPESGNATITDMPVTITTFAGSQCDRGPSNIHPINGDTCFGTSGMHSLQAANNHCGELVLWTYPEAGCNGNPSWSTWVDWTLEKCWNINTGGPWLSSKIRCIPG